MVMRVFRVSKGWRRWKEKEEGECAVNGDDSGEGGGWRVWMGRGEGIGHFFWGWRGGGLDI